MPFYRVGENVRSAGCTVIVRDSDSAGTRNLAPGVARSFLSAAKQMAVAAFIGLSVELVMTPTDSLPSSGRTCAPETG